MLSSWGRIPNEAVVMALTQTYHSIYINLLLYRNPLLTKVAIFNIKPDIIAHNSFPL
jgi:hypothetical protein